MKYLDRASNFVRRGETTSAFFELVNGLKGDPRNEDAVELLLDIYLNAIERRGTEDELLLALSRFPNGYAYLDNVIAQLESAGDHERLREIETVRLRTGVLAEDARAAYFAQPSAYAEPEMEAPAEAPENWAGFANPLTGSNGAISGPAARAQEDDITDDSERFPTGSSRVIRAGDVDPSVLPPEVRRDYFPEAASSGAPSNRAPLAVGVFLLVAILIGGAAWFVATKAPASSGEASAAGAR